MAEQVSHQGGKAPGNTEKGRLYRYSPVGFILHYNPTTPYFVRQHYKAVQLKMTVTPTAWFPEKASAMILFCVKDVFTAEKSEQRGEKQLPQLKLLECNKTAVGQGLERQRKQKCLRYREKMSSPH